MVCVMPHVTVLIGAAATGTAFIFQIIGLVTTGWNVNKEIDLNIGLWKGCQGSVCLDIQDIPGDLDYMKACQAFGILGVLAMGAALACVLLVCFTQTTLFLLLAIVATGAGALFAMIEFAVFVDKTFARDYLGYSFALTVVAVILCLVGVCFFLLAHRKSTAADTGSD